MYPKYYVHVDGFIGAAYVRADSEFDLFIVDKSGATKRAANYTSKDVAKYLYKELWKEITKDEANLLLDCSTIKKEIVWGIINSII